MDPHFTRAVTKVFVDLYNRGLLYRDKRLVNWDPKLKTAISDLEVDNREVPGHMWHFKYPLEGGQTYTYVERDADGAVVFEEQRDYIAIATTRPETMLGDGAVAVHPGDARYAPIVGKLCEIPVGPKEQRRLIPIITDEYPDPDFGSGAVKITGAHDANDYDVARRNGIPMYRLMDEAGHMRGDGISYAEAAARAREIATSGAPDANEVDALNLVPEAYRGLDRFEARTRVVADIAAEGLMLRQEDKLIVQPFGDRGGVVIEPMLTDQWYVAADKLAVAPIAAVRDGRIEIVPKTWEKTWFNWMENIQPWCVSRQLWWGHRIPAWYDADGQVYVADSEEAAQALAGNKPLTRDPDVLDTWFSSALWPFATLGWPGLNDSNSDRPELVEGLPFSSPQPPRSKEQGRSSTSSAQSGLERGRLLDRHYPNDLLISGFDILFFWDARMAMMGMHLMGEVPWRRLYLHGLVRAPDGQKMSKSKGNVVDPLGLIDRFGADALRFFMAAMESQGRDIKMDEKRVEGYRNFATKLWNAARFCQGNGISGGIGDHAGPGLDPQSAVNRWIVGEVVETLASLDKAMAELRFDAAANTIYHFVWDTFCDWYLELVKPLLNPPRDGEVADDAAASADGGGPLHHPADGPPPRAGEEFETRAIAGWVLDQILVMLHPFMPFVTEELWHSMGERPYELILAKWPEPQAGVDAEAKREVEWLIALTRELRGAKAELGIAPGARLDAYLPEAPVGTRRLVERNLAAIERLARLGSVRFEAAPAGAAMQVGVGNDNVVVPLAGVIDIAAEQARLAKARDAAAKERDGLARRLDNPAFVEKAKPEAVEKARADHAHHAAEAERLAAALARLG
jgi:valyl-tRNA synthetase